MSTPSWSEIRALPIAHEFGVAQHGEIHSRQSLTVPAAWVPPGFQVTPAHVQELGPFYFRRLERSTLRLIRVGTQTDDTFFNLPLPRLTLLHFAPRREEWQGNGGQVIYTIKGGLMLAGKQHTDGYLAMSLTQTGAGIEIGMSVESYYSRLSGSGTLNPLRRWFYTRTQAAAHHWLAQDFVRNVALAICEGTYGAEVHTA